MFVNFLTYLLSLIFHFILLYFPLKSLKAFSFFGFHEWNMPTCGFLSVLLGLNWTFSIHTYWFWSNLEHIYPLFIHIYMWSEVKSLSHVWLFATPWTRLLSPWDFPGKSTGMGCHSLLHIHKHIYGASLKQPILVDIFILPHGVIMVWFQAI